MGKIKDYAIGLAEAIMVINSCEFEEAMNYITSTPTEEVKEYIKENW